MNVSVRQLVSRLQTHSGFTFNCRVGVFETFTKGYAVSVKGCEERGWLAMESEALALWMSVYMNKYGRDLDKPGQYFGAWVDSDLVYLDVTSWVEDLDEALQLGRENGQKAIFDFAAGKAVAVSYEPVPGDWDEPSGP